MECTHLYELWFSPDTWPEVGLLLNITNCYKNEKCRSKLQWCITSHWSEWPSWKNSVQFNSVAQSSLILCDPMNCSTPGLPVHHNSRSILKLMSIELVMPSSHLTLCHPIFFLPTIPPSIRVFSNESNLPMRWPKYWSLSFSISPSNEHTGLISFRIDWLNLLAVQGTLKSLLQHHSTKLSIFHCSAFFTVQLSHPYMTTGKTIALTRRDLCWQGNVSAF